MSDFQIEAEVVPSVDRRAKRKVQEELSGEITVSGGGGSGGLGRNSPIYRRIDNGFDDVIDELRQLNDTADQLLGLFSTFVTARTGGTAFSVGQERGSRIKSGLGTLAQKAEPVAQDAVEGARLGLQIAEIVAPGGGAMLSRIDRNLLEGIKEGVVSLGQRIKERLKGDDRGQISAGLGIGAIGKLLGAGGGATLAGLGAGAGVAGTVGFGIAGLFDRLTGGESGKFKPRNIARGANLPNATLKQSDRNVTPDDGGIKKGESLGEFAGRRFDETLFQPVKEGAKKIANADLGASLDKVISDAKKQFSNISLNIDESRLPDIGVPDAISDFSWPALPDPITTFSWPTVPQSLKNFKFKKPNWLEGLTSTLSPSNITSKLSQAFSGLKLPAVDVSLPSFDFTPEINTSLNIDVNALISDIQSEIRDIAEDVVEDFIQEFERRLP